jgi:hypothetical protein
MAGMLGCLGVGWCEVGSVILGVWVQEEVQGCASRRYVGRRPARECFVRRHLSM